MFYRSLYYILGWEYIGQKEQLQIEKQKQLKYFLHQDLELYFKEPFENIELNERIKDKQKHLKFLMLKDLKNYFIKKNDNNFVEGILKKYKLRKRKIIKKYKLPFKEDIF